MISKRAYLLNLNHNKMVDQLFAIQQQGIEQRLHTSFYWIYF